MIVCGVEEFPYAGNVSVRIELLPYVLDTRASSQQSDRGCYDINQQFIV